MCSACSACLLTVVQKLCQRGVLAVTMKLVLALSPELLFSLALQRVITVCPALQLCCLQLLASVPAACLGIQSC